jgi:hypothetical protein
MGGIPLPDWPPDSPLDSLPDSPLDSLPDSPLDSLPDSPPGGDGGAGIPPLGGGGIPPDGGAGMPDVSDLQPPTTRATTTVNNRGLIHRITAERVWLCFIILSSLLRGVAVHWF